MPSEIDRFVDQPIVPVNNPLEKFPDYCKQCLDCEHDGLCEKYWAEDLQEWVWYSDEALDVFKTDKNFELAEGEPNG